MVFGWTRIVIIISIYENNVHIIGRFCIVVLNIRKNAQF